MEWFTGINQERFEYIKAIIDDSDYFVLILGLYGTITFDNISYTEKEYDYAVKKGKNNKNGSKKPSITETDDERKIKFTLFHKKVTQDKLVNMWSSNDELV